MTGRKGWFIGVLALFPFLGMGQQYRSYTVKKDRLTILLREGELDIQPLTAKAIRVRWTKGLFNSDSDLILIHHPPAPKFTFVETAVALRMSTGSITVNFDKASGVIDYRGSDGHVFLQESGGGRRLQPDTVMGQRCYIAEQSFVSPADEDLFGLGQFQDGNFNLRNISRQLIQVNTQIAVPFLYSSKGYGLLWNQYGMTDFNPADSMVPLAKTDSIKGSGREAEVTTTAGTQKVSQRQSLYTGSFELSKAGSYCMMLDLGNMDNRHLLVIDGRPVIDESNLWLPPAAGKMVELTAGTHTVQIVCRAGNSPKLSWRAASDETTFRSPNASCLDYVVFAGRDADEVIGNYRELSGTVPLLPRWAYGFWQCRERYTSGEHLVNTVEEFRKRHLPMDVIVQDWQYWGKYGWGVPKFDEDHYPDPDHFIAQLHDLHAHFVISVWENLDKRSEVAKPYVEKNLYLPNSPWIDIFNPETRRTHWAALNDNLFRHGVDGWWMDATEPENDALKGKQTFFGPGDLYRLTYPLFVSRAVYEGQRAADPGKRVCILTRSAFAGQQRYGTINWSGDIGSTWDSYRRQIVAGLDYAMTGLPYWTTDIGGFFRPGKGQYTDPGYRELLTRWFQWGALNPVFRTHGYQTETEPWNYGDTVMENMRIMLELRYRLMPYIYGTAWQVTRHGSTMMRPLVMDFGKDSAACAQPYEYMFGKALLVAPVTEPGVREADLYLPRGTGWYDLWTGKHYPGGRIRADAPLNRMPIFVRAGSVVPMGPVVQSTTEAKDDSLEIRIYTGADGRFTLYSDEGDGYNYEKGKYQEVALRWDDKKQTLSIGNVAGGYAGNLRQRVFRVVWIDGGGERSRTIRYKGKAMIASPVGSGRLMTFRAAGDSIRIKNLTAAKKLAIRYSSLGVGALELAINGRSARKINIHSTGDLLNSFLNAVVSVNLPAGAVLTLKLLTDSISVNIDRLATGENLKLPPDIWNLPALPVAGGPYTGDWKSLGQNYLAPDWWREAKFGAWSHWDPQSMPEMGDWYAREMYRENSPIYKFHVGHFGHPSEYGYKDIAHAWVIDKWDPEELMNLYVEMGARYFVAMGVHHDNFDCWNSTYQPWNSVNVGPKRDIVGTWEKIARKHGLRFGIGFHNTPARTWGQFMPVRYGADRNGPMKGIPYDGLLTIADGKGKWWKGMDPVDLYGPAHSSKDDPLLSPFANQFMWRVNDAITRYHPDMIYFDEHAGNSQVDLGVHMGLGFLAPQLIANYYNLSLGWNHHKMDVVVNLKGVGGRYNSFQHDPDLLPLVDHALVKSSEAIIEPEIMAYPFQTETSIADWHYRTGQKYMDAATIVGLLLQNVSRNGSMLLNITQHGRGDLDEEAIRICKDVGAWLKINGEGIYGSRPFEVCGDSALYYTRNKGNIYAAVLHWNNEPVTLKALAANGATIGRVTRVELLGANIELPFVQSDSGLTIVPAKPIPSLNGIANTGLANLRVMRITQEKRWTNDDDPGVTKARGWFRQCNLNRGDFNNDLTISNTPGAVWEYSFTGRGVALVAPRDTGAGKIEVIIDGNKKATVALGAPIRQPQQIVYRSGELSPGKHSLRIVNPGTRQVAIDAVIILNTQ